MDRKRHRLIGCLKDGDGEHQHKDGSEIKRGDRYVGQGGVVMKTAKSAVLLLRLTLMMMVKETMGRTHKRESQYDG